MIDLKDKLLVLTRFLQRLSPMANRFRSSRVPAPQRQFIWSDIFTRLSAVAVAGVKVAAGVSAVGLTTGGGLTLIRTRGRLTAHFDSTSISDVVLCAVGLGVYSSDAFAIGQTAMPGPISDGDYDWIYHHIWTFGPSVAAAESEVAITENINIEVDSKVMRKIKPNQTIGWITESLTLSGGGSMDMSVVARHLFKLG